MTNERIEFLKARGYCMYASFCESFYAVESDCKQHDGGNCEIALLNNDRIQRMRDLRVVEAKVFEGCGACDYETVLRLDENMQPVKDGRNN